METDNRRDEIIKSAVHMDFHPVEFVDKSRLKEYRKIPVNEIGGLAAMFAEMLPGFRTVAGMTSVNTEGLWRCSFPSGVSGELAKFKDGSGYMGTIMNNGFAGQARWNPVHSVSASQTFTFPISPLNIFMAAAIMEMNHKLEKIQQLGEEILNYQKDRDRAEQEADFESLTEVYDKFKYNLDNETWKKLKYSLVQEIRHQALARIKFLRTQITRLTDRRDPIHNVRQASQMIDEVHCNFQMYRLAVFMYSFSTYLEVLLMGNFSADYLESVGRDIEHRAATYREFYIDCYDKLERFSETALESRFLKGISKASSEAGKFIHKIPVVEKGPVDEALMEAGKSVKKFTERQKDKALLDFRENMQDGSQQFVKGIEKISQLYNSPMEVLTDGEQVYLKFESE